MAARAAAQGLAGIRDARLGRPCCGTRIRCLLVRRRFLRRQQPAERRAAGLPALVSAGDLGRPAGGSGLRHSLGRVPHSVSEITGAQTGSRVPGPDQPFDSRSPSSGAKGPWRRSNQCLYALTGCLSGRSRSRSTGPYQSTGTPRTRCGSSSCLADGSTPRGIPKTLFRSSRSLAIGQPLWWRGWPGTRRPYSCSMTRPPVTDKLTDPVRHGHSSRRCCAERCRGQIVTIHAGYMLVPRWHSRAMSRRARKPAQLLQLARREGDAHVLPHPEHCQVLPAQEAAALAIDRGAAGSALGYARA